MKTFAQIKSKEINCQEYVNLQLGLIKNFSKFVGSGSGLISFSILLLSNIKI